MSLLHYIKYFPMGLRDSSSTPVVADGPYFKKRWKKQIEINDNTLFFEIPWYNPVLGTEGRSSGSYRKSYIKNKICLKTHRLSKVSPEVPNGRWLDDTLFAKQWVFNGPWFTGKAGRMSLFISLIGYSSEVVKNTPNFLHPRAFESAVADFLSSVYGHKKFRNKPDFRAPINWQVSPLSETISGATFDIYDQSDDMGENPQVDTVLIFPISPNRMVYIKAHFWGARLKSSNFIDEKNIFAFGESVLKSFKLEVGAQALEQWNEVKKTCPDMSLTEDFAELKWPIKPEDVGKVVPPAPQAEQIEVERKNLV